MTKIGILSFPLAIVMKPGEGVSPPSAKDEHSSILKQAITILS
jgi:hypothetical protein